MTSPCAFRASASSRGAALSRRVCRAAVPPGQNLTCGLFSPRRQELQIERCGGSPRWLRVRTSAAPKLARAGGAECSGSGLGLIVGDQGDRLARRHDCVMAPIKPRAEARVIGTQAGRGLRDLVAMPSSTRSGVVHRVVEPRRRHFPFLRGERLAHLMQRFAPSPEEDANTGPVLAASRPAC